MKKTVLFVLVFACVIGYTQLQPKMYRYMMNNPNSEIIIYGNEGCPVCKLFRSGLSENKIAYTFKDVIKDASAKQELSDRLKQTDRQEQAVHLPVVVVDNEILFYYDFPRFMREKATKQFVLFK